jgi:BolA family transcriptional regulator, general stress-responsive regulator
MTTIAANHRVDLITQRLSALSPSSLVVRDDSAAHHGHAGAADGGGHFHVVIASAAFEGKNKVARHRLVYQTVSDLMPRTIHALSIEAKAHGEI